MHSNQSVSEPVDQSQAFVFETKSDLNVYWHICSVSVTLLLEALSHNSQLRACAFCAFERTRAFLHIIIIFILNSRRTQTREICSNEIVTHICSQSRTLLLFIVSFSVRIVRILLNTELYYRSYVSLCVWCVYVSSMYLLGMIEDKQIINVP